MAIKISVVSEKGGVGKTTCAANIAGGLVRLGKKVLVADLDQQQNMSATLGYEKDGKPTVSELIYNAVADIETDYESAVRHSEKGIDYIPSSAMLTNITSTMANDTDSNYILKRIFDSKAFDEYDFIIYDCRTLLDLLASNALNASDYVVIPVESGVYAYDGLEKMIGKVSSVNNSTNRKLRILGILLNKQQRTNISASVAESIKSDYENITFETSIPYCPAQTEQAIIRRESCVFDDKSSLGKAFAKIAEEVVRRIENVR
ncbi:MAG: ParA family protein [Ruminococcus sp.]|nr:ParA family protein [Ruminococcus sp.]